MLFLFRKNACSATGCISSLTKARPKQKRKKPKKRSNNGTNKERVDRSLRQKRTNNQAKKIKDYCFTLWLRWINRITAKRDFI